MIDHNIILFMKNKKRTFTKSLKLNGNEQIGLLITTYGAMGEVEDQAGNIIRCHIRKNADSVITGDSVYWLPEKKPLSGVIVGHLPRKSLLSRTDGRKLKRVAANLDAIIIVTAPSPVLSEEMVDRYLVAAETLQIQPIILMNKTDLLADKEKNEISNRLDVYEKIGYTILYSSILTPDGLTELNTFLHHKTCVLVGASGVGKSSIIAKLTAESNIRVGEVSNGGLGKHTTTSTHLYHLTHGGNLIDSPGVREFGLSQMNSEEIANGFIELKPFHNQCKFRDCLHIDEPDCAVRNAVTNHTIDARRYQSYLKLLIELNKKNKVH